jgi:tRNA(Ile)-lysidine synthase
MRVEATSEDPIPAGLPREQYRLVEEFARAFAPEAAGGAVLAAVSGGADSMALLELLTLSREKLRLETTVAYVDHGLRPEAQSEAELVRARAASHGHPFLTRKLSSDGLAGSGLMSSEASLRRRRYEALAAMAAECGAKWIATAHVHEDQVETILFRLLRGAGRLGLSGIPVRRGQIIRPLLGIRRARLRRFLVDRQVAWAEDSTNTDPRYARNRLRHQVVPAIETAFGAGALDALPEMARRWRAEEDYLDEQTGRYLTFAAGPDFLDLVAFGQVPVGLRSRVLRRWLERMNGGRMVTLRQLAAVEQVIEHPRNGERISVAGLRLSLDAGRLAVHNG